MPDKTRAAEPAHPDQGMSFAAFSTSLSGEEPPRGLLPVLSALWWAKKGGWDRAHRIVMDEDGRDAAWVHAYLHRIEGDLGNAAYWYSRAGRPPSNDTLEAEWSAMTAELLARTP